MKKTIVNLLIGAMLVGLLTSNVYGGLITNYVEDTSWINKSLEVTACNAGLFYNGQYLNIKYTPLVVGGRLYVPMKNTIEAFKGTLQKDSTNFKITIDGKSITLPINTNNEKIKKVAYNKGVAYISLFELLEGIDMVPVFNSTNSTINIYHRQSSSTGYTKPKGYEKKAYIRFEDIVADGVEAKGTYNDNGLEKLRFMSDYMHERGQEFYIAWIPVYVNPATGVVNDVSKDLNFYNASFVYTLDYLIANGGHLGLHGYTHQYGCQKSADGFEFGVNSPYTNTQRMERMVSAKTVANTLGYSEEFFEFPHYGATNADLDMAEHYFDVIYQSHPKKSVENVVTYAENENGKTFYIPTPVDYVYYRDDVEGIKKRIDTAISNGWAVSMFFHPNIDFQDVVVTTQDNTRTWSYKDGRVLTEIVDYVLSKGYSFGKLDK